MTPYPPAEDVIRDLGDKVVSAVIDSTTGARADLEGYRDAFAGWVADHSERGLSNWIHDRMWAHLRRSLDDVDGVELVDHGATREVRVGLRYRARVKRHDVNDRVRSYPTKTALAFWAQSPALEGFDEVRLAFGYRWNPDERIIGSAVVSLRDGLDKEAIWVVVVGVEGAGAAAVINWTPLDPTLPQIDLHQGVAADQEDERPS